MKKLLLFFSFLTLLAACSDSRKDRTIEREEDVPRPRRELVLP